MYKSYGFLKINFFYRSKAWSDLLYASLMEDVLCEMTGMKIRSVSRLLTSHLYYFLLPAQPGSNCVLPQSCVHKGSCAVLGPSWARGHTITLTDSIKFCYLLNESQPTFSLALETRGRTGWTGCRLQTSCPCLSTARSTRLCCHTWRQHLLSTQISLSVWPLHTPDHS